MLAVLPCDASGLSGVHSRADEIVVDRLKMSRLRLRFIFRVRISVMSVPLGCQLFYSTGTLTVVVYYTANYRNEHNFLIRLITI